MILLLGEEGTALHQGLSKYLTAQDTHITPALIKHNRTLAWLGNLLSLQPRSTIQVNDFLSLVLSELIKKTRYSGFEICSVFMARSFTQVHFPPIMPSSFIWNTYLSLKCPFSLTSKLLKTSWTAVKGLQTWPIQTANSHCSQLSTAVSQYFK